MLKVSRYLILSLCLTITACATSNSVRYGNLNGSQYNSENETFTLAIQQGTTIFDGKHALGGYAVTQNLPAPIDIQGISYNRAVNIQDGLSEKAEKDMIKSSNDFWAKTYSGSKLTTIYDEWVVVDGKTAYVAVFETPTSGFLVKPHIFYGALSFLRKGHTYTIFDKVTTSKRLIATEGRDTEASLAIRKKALLDFYKRIKIK